jgi:integrase
MNLLVPLLVPTVSRFGRYQQMPLTDVWIRGAKPRKTPFKLSDGHGLHLLVKPNGSRLWRLAYRFDGKQKLLAFGSYPLVTLAGARERRDAARKLLTDGVDPGERRKFDKLTARVSRETTFETVAAALLAKKMREGRAAATLSKSEWLVGIANAGIGRRPITDISAPEVLDVLRKVETKGRLESARRLRSVIGEVFRFAIATGRANTDPTFALRGALTTPTVKNRAAITNAAGFGALLRAIEGYDGQPETKAALQLMALLFPRPGELRNAVWSEFDLDGAVWTIPASRTKMRREHRVPLPLQAIAILRDLHKLTGAGKGGLVFPGTRVVTRAISENTMNAALRRLGYSADEVTAHGFRATASTLLNESGKWSPDAIERALAHQDEDNVRRAYARGAHWQERVAMAQWWADYLDALRAGANILAFARGTTGPTR